MLPHPDCHHQSNFNMFSFLFFLPITVLVSTEKKMLNCTDKLLHDHQNSSSCLILLGNFSTVANLGFTEVNMKDLSLENWLFRVPEFWFSQWGPAVYSVRVFYSLTVHSCSPSAEMSQGQQDNKQLLFPRQTNVEDWFESLQRGKPKRRYQHDKEGKMR